MNNSDKRPQGCLAFLFGFGSAAPRQAMPAETEPDTDLMSPEDEGNAHSGPGGYEGMGYSGGYAADYFNQDEGEH